MKNKILKAITAIAGVLMVLSMCAMDSDSWLPFIVYVSCIAWLGVFTEVNKDYL